MTGELTLASVRLFVALIALVVAVSLVAHRAGLPYSVALVIAGLVVSLAAPRQSITITPELVLAVLLPGLVFEASFQTPFEALRRTLVPVALLAIPGVVIVATVVAAVLSIFAGIDARLGFLVGAMVAATDPVAVVTTFERIRAPADLVTLVEAESLLNDGTGIVLFSIALASVSGQDTGLASGLVAFVWVILASLGLGVLTGLFASWAIGWTTDHQVELAISLVLAYGTYLAADAVHLSGLIATVVAGVAFGTYGRSHGMSPAAREAIDVVWDFLAFLLTALVFLLIGLSIGLQDLASAAGPIAWGIVAILGGRALVVYGLVGGGGRLLRATGREGGPPIAWLHVMFWAGLRGAVSVALALSLPADLAARDLLQGTTFGIVLFTLVVQGSSAGAVVRRALGIRSSTVMDVEGTPP